MSTATAPRQVNVQLEAFGQQAGFIADGSPFSAAVSGVGGGKTEAGAIKALAYAYAHPGSLGMVTAPTFPMLRDATIRTVQKVWPEGAYTFLAGEMRLIASNGSEVLFRTTDDPNHLRGPNLAWVWMDEAAQGTAANPDSQYDSYLVLQGRLRQQGYPPQLWVTTTPNGYNWVYREFAKAKRPDYSLYTWSARDNPFLTAAFIRHLEESYPDRFALQEIEGQFVITSGSAYFQTEAVTGMLGDCREPEMRAGGLVRIWRKPVVGAKYVGFGDVSWGRQGDFCCFPLADWQTGEQVAEIYGRPEHDEYAKAIADVTTEYNKAYFGVEANGDGGSERSGLNVVNKLIDLGVGDRMYHHGEKWRQEQSQRGWLTTGVTRPVMLGELEEAVRLRGIVPRCREGVSEFLSFVRNEKGRAEATAGAHDDHPMAWAGLWQMRKEAKYSVGGSTRLPAGKTVYGW